MTREEANMEEELVVVGTPVPKAVNKKPTLFWSRWWSPISYILYLWFSPILTLVSYGG